MKEIKLEKVAEAMRTKGYRVDSKRWNLVGIRASSRKAGKFDDRFVMFRGSGPRAEGWSAAFTTDPGIYYLRDRLLSPKGAAILVTGQYRYVYKVDKHRGVYDALCQRGGPVKVYRDKNKDLVLDLDASTMEDGWFGINIHRDGYSDGGSDILLRASAGCQVFRYRKDFDRMMTLAKAEVQAYGNAFTYTLLDEADLAGPPGVVTTVVPEAAGAPDWSERAARVILDWEARRDSKGRLVVYDLPASDGGGSFEVAGINARYHEATAHRLKHLIESGEYAAAEREAVEHIRRYVADAGRLSSHPGVRLFLADCRFNRGPKGSVQILQRALDVEPDGLMGEATRKALAAARPEELLPALLLARQGHERVVVGRDESSRFWKGLKSRWIKAYNAAVRETA